MLTEETDIFPVIQNKEIFQIKQANFSFILLSKAILLDDFVFNLSNRQWDFFTIYVCELSFTKSSNFFCLTKKENNIKNEQVSFLRLTLAK